MQISCPYSLSDSCEDTQEGIVLRVENRKSRRQSFFPGCWQACYEEHAPFTEARRSCQRTRPEFGHITGPPPQVRERHVIHGTPPGLSSGTPDTSPHKPAENRETAVIVVLTLLTRFGILDVRHSFGAQGPDGDSQLKKWNMEITQMIQCQREAWKIKMLMTESKKKKKKIEI